MCYNAKYLYDILFLPSSSILNHIIVFWILKIGTKAISNEEFLIGKIFNQHLL